MEMQFFNLDSEGFQDYLTELQVRGKSRHVSPAATAGIHSVLGEEAHEERSDYIGAIRGEFILVNLKSEPRFEAFFQMMGLRRRS